MLNNYIKKKSAPWKYCLALSLLLVPSVASAQNSYTTAGIKVSNDFTLTYDVAGVEQASLSADEPARFTVDRKVDLTVQYMSSDNDLNVPPGATGEELIFMLRNDGNDNFSYGLTTENDAAAGTVFEATSISVRYYSDVGDDGVFTPGTDDADGTAMTNITQTDDLAPDAVYWVEVSGNIPASVVNDNTALTAMIAQTLYPAAWITATEVIAGGQAGTAITTTSSNTQESAADNVLADSQGSNDSLIDGKHSAKGTFTVASPDLVGTKLVSVASSNLDGLFACDVMGNAVTATEQYAVAGACVEYVISIENTGSVDAEVETFSDTLPTELTFQSATFSGFTGGTTSAPAKDKDCSASGGCVISQSGGTIADTETALITIRALVN